MNPEDPATVIEKYLQEEKDFYQKLLKKLEEQVAAIQHEDENRLNALIEEKKPLLQSTRNIESQMETVVLALDPEELGRVARINEGLRREVEEIVKSIVKMEDHCQVELKARKFIVKDQLLDVKKGKTMLKGYASVKKVKPTISNKV